MTVEEARKLIEEMTFEKNDFSKEEEFQIHELSKYICEQEKSGIYASFIGNKYIENGKMDLALYYLELAVEYGDLQSYQSVGNIYYFGWSSCGKNLKKAFECYSKAAEVKKTGDGTWENPISDVHNEAKISLARMYKNGDYVEKNYEEYKKLINEVYEESKDETDNEQIKYAVLKEMAVIAKEDGNLEKAREYLYEAMYSSMKSYCDTLMFEELYIIDEFANMIYEIEEIDITNIDFPEIFYLLKKPCKIKFELNEEEYHIESLYEKDSIVIKIGNQWFKDVEKMIDKAIVDEKELKYSINDIYYWEVEEWMN